MQRLPIGIRVGCLLLLAGLPALPTTAQTCLGSPAEPGGFTLGVGGIRTGGDSGGFLKGRVNLAGPLAFSSRIGLEERQQGSNAFVAAGTGVVEWSYGGADLCPTAGFTHTVWTDRSGAAEVNRSELRFPLGVAVGTRAALGEGMTLYPWVHGGVLPSRVRIRTEAGDDAAESTWDTEVAAFFGGGATVLAGRVFLRAGVAVLSLDERRPVYSVELGYRIPPGI